MRPIDADKLRRSFPTGSNVRTIIDNTPTIKVVDDFDGDILHRIVIARHCKGKYYDQGTKQFSEFNKGIFHQFGNTYTEFESGPGNLTIAIIELEDGKVITALPEDIKFLD